MKTMIKNWIKKLPIPLTKNHRYDLETKKVIRKVCQATSNCVDVGCFKGEILDLILQYAPQGQHFAFEPIPALFEGLQGKFPPNCHIYNLGLSNQKGNTSFNYVLSNPSYSGFVRRKYDKPNEKDTLITVQTDTLDHILPPDLPVHLIKIDVEGAELLVLEGARETLRRYQPIVIFEHGLGGADCYGAGPAQVFQLFFDCGMSLSTMQRWLKGKEPFSEAAFVQQFEMQINYYFIAYPTTPVMAGA